MLPILLTMAALAMPVIAWLSQEGRFGPDNKTLSDQYPTLLVADGYAFSIWGVIFLLDLLLALWTLRGQRHPAPAMAAARHRCLLLMTAGFALTASWMVVFSQRWFWLALAIIWGALICLLWALMLVAHARPTGAAAWMTLLPLGLHAGWLSLAAFLNTAQVIVAQQLLPTVDQLPWTLVLWGLAALLLLVAIARLHQPMSAWPALAYVVAAVWGLVGVYVKQSRGDLPGAAVSAWIAAVLAGVLVAQTVWLRWRRGQPPRAQDDEGLMSYRPH